MVVLIGIVAALFLLGLLFLFRSAGRFGQRPGTPERTRHSAGRPHDPGPRATGVN